MGRPPELPWLWWWEARVNNPMFRFVDWIRNGYPAGLPAQDVLPLMALLRRRLGEDEVHEVCDALVEAGVMPADRVDVGVEIIKTIDEMPNLDDVDRVLNRLHTAGWPVDDEV